MIILRQNLVPRDSESPAFPKISHWGRQKRPRPSKLAPSLRQWCRSQATIALAMSDDDGADCLQLHTILAKAHIHKGLL